MVLARGVVGIVEDVIVFGIERLAESVLVQALLSEDRLSPMRDLTNQTMQ